MGFPGKVTFVTGPEKHCGKTSYMNRAAALARRALGQTRGPVPGLGPVSGPALLSIGYDGEARDFLSGLSKPSVPVCRGDIIVTTERFARPCMPEILEVLPGSTALGRLCIARVGRPSAVALLGPEGNSLVAWAVELIRKEKLSTAIFVDGAINRITQAAMIPDSVFVYVLRVDPSNLKKSTDRMQRIYTLANLPLYAPEQAENAFFVSGALSRDTAARLPAKAKTVVIDDFTKLFLDAAELRSFLRERRLFVKRQIGFDGFVLIQRGLEKKAVLDMLEPEVAKLVTFNPYDEDDAA